MFSQKLFVVGDFECEVLSDASVLMLYRHCRSITIQMCPKLQCWSTPPLFNRKMTSARCWRQQRTRWVCSQDLWHVLSAAITFSCSLQLMEQELQQTGLKNIPLEFETATHFLQGGALKQHFCLSFTWWDLWATFCCYETDSYQYLILFFTHSTECWRKRSQIEKKAFWIMPL